VTLLQAVRGAIRARHYSRRTEEAYVAWVGTLRSAAGGTRASSECEVRAFLTALAVDCRVSAAMQNQALAALLFLYRDVLDAPMLRVCGTARARRQGRQG
jgi:hypothetical protein